MSLGKLPGIKGLVSNSQGKRQFKSDLSVDMISPPLGDFRHTMHVGRGGDVFGDTSFLSNHGGPAADEEPESPPWSSKTTRFFSRTLRHVRKTPARPRTGSRDLSPPPPPVSPIIKNAVSLPQLNLDAPNGSLQRVLFPSSSVSPDDLAYSAYSYGLQSGFLTLPRLSRLDRQMQDSSGDLRRETPGNDSDSLSLTRSESISSFTVDLGPSLMSEVFAVIDSPRCGQVANHTWEEEEAGPHVTFDLTVDSGVVHSATGCGVESPPRMDWNGRGSPDVDGRENTQAIKRAVPGVSTESTPRVEPGMEPVRFQRATDVLARHYGGGGLLKTQPQTEGRENQHLCPTGDSGTGIQRTAPYAYPEEEDEIKV